MFERLHQGLIGLGVVFIAGIAALSFVQILCRYLLGVSIPWSNDLTQIMMMWMVMVTAGAMLWRGSHFTLMFLADRLPAPVQRGLRILVAILIAAFAVFLMVTGARLADSQSSQLVPALGITYFYVYLAMPIGALFILVFALGLTRREAIQETRDPADTEDPT